jgi:UDP-N-acetylmuramyl pentapeptide phosphotransferase/UDP-N-acetylglucosamine-1-phosphate transferase
VTNPFADASVLGVLALAPYFVLAPWYVAYCRPGWLPFPVVANHRGWPVPVSLGWGVLAAEVPSVAAAVGALVRGAPGAWGTDLIAEALPAVVFAVGLYDDFRPSREHGIRSHLGALVGGRLTSGIVKLVVIVAAALTWVLLQETFGVRALISAAVIAGCANLWNLLDVTPGRSLKAALVATVALFAARPTSFAFYLILTQAVLLRFDLRERGMLGDGGSNLVGFFIGILLVRRASVPWEVAALVIIVGLHAVAETVTLSKVIRSSPPLRWFDRLGRMQGPAEPTEPPHATSP